MRQRGKGYRLLRGLAAALVLSAALGAAAVWWWLNQPLSLARPSIEVSIEAGSTPRDVAQAWVDAGVQTDASWLYAWFRVSGQARRIRAGSYEIEPGTTPRTLLEVLVQGRETLQTVRLLEGWTLRQVRDALAAAPNLKATTRAWDDARLMQEIGAPGVSAEGRFFPDTYAYARGVSDLTVLRRAYRTMQQRLAAVWADRSGDTPLKSADEALILASIVEKETGTATDRPLIAGVFINRLRLGLSLIHISEPTRPY